MDILLYTILAVTFIEVKILLYLSIKVLMQKYQEPNILVAEEDKDHPLGRVKTYDDLVTLVNKL